MEPNPYEAPKEAGSKQKKQYSREEWGVLSVSVAVLLGLSLIVALAVLCS